MSSIVFIAIIIIFTVIIFGFLDDAVAINAILCSNLGVAVIFRVLVSVAVRVGGHRHCFPSFAVLAALLSAIAARAVIIITKNNNSGSNDDDDNNSNSSNQSTAKTTATTLSPKTAPATTWP